jgi:hypothetical protein
MVPISENGIGTAKCHRHWNRCPRRGAPRGRPTRCPTNDEIQNGTGYPKMVPEPRHAPGIGLGARAGAPLRGRPTRCPTNDEIQNGTGYPKMVPGPRHAPGIGTGARAGAPLAGAQPDPQQMMQSEMLRVIRKWYRNPEMPTVLERAPARGAPALWRRRKSARPFIPPMKMTMHSLKCARFNMRPSVQ